jgi:hypothetical protein
LFGSLLGTLSQAPSTAAQQRRADIERKQQAKLKSQEAEYDEGRRKKLEDLATARRKEQRVYERSAVCRNPLSIHDDALVADSPDIRWNYDTPICSQWRIL